MLSFQSCHKRVCGVDAKEMFKQVPTARIEELLENHDVHTTIENLIGETPVKSDNDDDSASDRLNYKCGMYPHRAKSK